MAEDIKKTPETQAPEAPQPEPKMPSIDELTATIKTLQTQLDKAKKATDNASSDAASWKAKFRATQDEAQRAEDERKERDAEKDKLIETLMRKDAVSSYKTSYLAMGYTEELASQKAEALVDGDFLKANEIEKAFIAKQKSDIEAGILNNQPKLTHGTTPTKDSVVSAELMAIRRAAGLEK